MCFIVGTFENNRKPGALKTSETYQVKNGEVPSPKNEYACVHTSPIHDLCHWLESSKGKRWYHLKSVSPELRSMFYAFDLGNNWFRILFCLIRSTFPSISWRGSKTDWQFSISLILWLYNGCPNWTLLLINAMQIKIQPLIHWPGRLYSWLMFSAETRLLSSTWCFLTRIKPLTSSFLCSYPASFSWSLIFIHPRHLSLWCSSLSLGSSSRVKLPDLNTSLALPGICRVTAQPGSHQNLILVTHGPEWNYSDTLHPWLYNFRIRKTGKDAWWYGRWTLGASEGTWVSDKPEKREVSRTQGVS